jgi:hypothetical protein
MSAMVGNERVHDDIALLMLWRPESGTG